MTKRSYGQFCGVAKALDVLGERWTLLVVRELLPGPRRYRDLADQLPDIATDLLTARLRVLMENGLVDRHETGGVGGGVTYALTLAGQRLRPLLEELAQVGLTLLERPTATSDTIALRWVFATVRLWLDASQCPVGSCDFMSEGERFRLRNDGSTVEFSYGSDTEPPDSFVQGSKADMAAVLTGHATPDACAISLAGDRTSARKWILSVASAMPRPIRAE